VNAAGRLQRVYGILKNVPNWGSFANGIRPRRFHVKMLHVCFRRPSGHAPRSRQVHCRPNSIHAGLVVVVPDCCLFSHRGTEARRIRIQGSVNDPGDSVAHQCVPEVQVSRSHSRASQCLRVSVRAMPGTQWRQEPSSKLTKCATKSANPRLRFWQKPTGSSGGIQFTCSRSILADRM
jgi:hypothetical protein